LFVRPRNDFDGAFPSGVSTAVMVLLKVARLTGKEDYAGIAKKALGSVSKAMGKTPLGTSQWLCDLDFYLAPPGEIVIVGAKDDVRTRELADEINSKWLPDTVIAITDLDSRDSVRDLSIFKDKDTVNGQPAVYVCRNYTCTPPITDARELEERLRGEKQAVKS
jgi:uncharacterized protein